MRQPVPLVSRQHADLDSAQEASSTPAAAGAIPLKSERHAAAARFSPRIGRPDRLQRTREELAPEPDPVRDVVDRPLVVDDLLDYWPTARVRADCTLTPTIACAILNLIRGGSFWNTAARYSGVRTDAFRSWMQNGSEPYVTFQRWVDIADAFAEHSALRVVRASKDPKAALAYLSRRFPKHWAEERSLGHQGASVNVDLTGLLERVSARLHATPMGEVAHVIEGEAVHIAAHDPRRQLASQTGREIATPPRVHLDAGELKMPADPEPAEPLSGPSDEPAS